MEYPVEWGKIWRFFNKEKEETGKHEVKGNLFSRIFCNMLLITSVSSDNYNVIFSSFYEYLKLNSNYKYYERSISVFSCPTFPFVISTYELSVSRTSFPQTSPRTSFIKIRHLLKNHILYLEKLQKEFVNFYGLQSAFSRRVYEPIPKIAELF